MSKSLDMTANENCVCFNIRRASRALSQFMAAELGHHGLMPTQTPILGILSAIPDASMAEISEGLGMDRTTLLRNLRPLERDGLVEATGKGRGGRVSLRLTPKGEAALGKLLPDWREAQRKVLDTLGAARWAEILVDLDRAAHALKK
jgi:DNA-binding MarR family transcriptional regulator